MGNFDAADQFLANVKAPVHLRGHQAFIKHQYAEAADLFSPTLSAKPGPEEKRGVLIYIGLVQRLLGHKGASKASYQRAVQEFTEALSTVPAGAGADLHSGLGLDQGR